MLLLLLLVVVVLLCDTVLSTVLRIRCDTIRCSSDRHKCCSSSGGSS